MADPPVDNTGTLLHFIDGSYAYAGHFTHERSHPVHTHSFFEVAVVMGGTGLHHTPAGHQELAVGDVVLLRPGVWHGYDDCVDLDLFNCCFSADLLQHELGWTREDALLSYLLWTGPNTTRRRGVLTGHLDAVRLEECVSQLEHLEDLCARPLDQHRGDVIGRLSLFLSALARAMADDVLGAARTAHPAVLTAMRLMESDPAHHWTLTELAAELHLAPGYLVRLFKSSTGLPPMAYLSRHRVELAADRLLHTDEPISRIGEAVGWPDQNYFARRFKSHYGFSATTYRARFSRA